MTETPPKDDPRNSSVGSGEDGPPPADQGSTVGFTVDAADVGERLDRFLAARLPDASRAQVQQWIEGDRVSVIPAGERTPRRMKAGGRVRAGETILVASERTAPPPLRAQPEPIPLHVIYEDAWLAAIDKPAGMAVHSGAGATDTARNGGTLVNALLYRMASLSGTGGPLRPGIVHRLDKQTSGLILVAKNDRTHRQVSEMFARRQVHKKYLALVHGTVQPDRGTVNASIHRDRQRRTRMTTRRAGGRTAVSHYRVQQRIDSRFGRFTLLEVEIETGRTHQIRVHLASIGHPVVGDTTYGAPQRILPRIEAPATRKRKEAAAQDAIHLPRNFLHATHLELIHPETGDRLVLDSPLPADLRDWMAQLTLPEKERPMEKATGPRNSH